MNIKITNHTMVLNLDYTPHVKDCYNDDFGNFWIIDSVKLINTIIPNKPGYSCFEIQFSTIDEFKTAPQKMRCYNITIENDKSSQIHFNGKLVRAVNYSVFKKLYFCGCGSLFVGNKEEKSWLCCHIKIAHNNDKIESLARILVGPKTAISLSENLYYVPFKHDKMIDMRFKNEPFEFPVKLIMTGLEKLAKEYME